MCSLLQKFCDIGSFRTIISCLIIRIETDLACAGLNSAHVGFKRLNKPAIGAAAPQSAPKPTSRCQSSLSIWALKED